MYKRQAKIFKKPEIIYAVKKVSFDVKFGETIAIVGESGSGKSTVAKIINGLINKDEGKVEIKGQNIEDIEISDRAKIIQPVFQDPYSTLNPIHTIGYIVSRPLTINENKSESEVKEEVIKILGLVGLSEEYYNRFPNQLSGGQRQRVAIARAIILKPQILICDEPTSALDVTIQSQILDLLNDLKQKLKITIILISHDISVVKYFSDRIIVMYNGQIVETGNSEEIINNPKETYTKKLMSSVFSLKQNNKILAHVKKDDNNVSILLDIKSVEPQYVNQINIYGNSRTFDYVIRRELLISEGIEDIESSEDNLTLIFTDANNIHNVKTVLENENIEILQADMIMDSSQTVKLDSEATEKVIRLIESLEDLDDVQNVFSNAEFSLDDNN